MGTWGYGLYSDDVTRDVKDIYVDKLRRGKSGMQASKEMMHHYFGLQWQIYSGIMAVCKMR